METDIMCAVEALLFVCGEPVALAELAALFELPVEQIEEHVARLEREYAQGRRGIVLQRMEDKVRMCTNRQYAAYVEKLLQPEENKVFSQSLIETLAIVAYKQPITRAEIEAIRGVRCEYAVSQLVHMGLIEDKGRKNVIGRPIMLGTTDRFLQHFDIRSLEELPGIAQFESIEELSV